MEFTGKCGLIMGLGCTKQRQGEATVEVANRL